MKQFTLTPTGVEYREQDDEKSKHAAKRLIFELSALFAVGLAGGAYIVYLVRAPRADSDAIAFAPNASTASIGSSRPTVASASAAPKVDSISLLRRGNPVADSAQASSTRKVEEKHPIKDAVRWLQAVAKRKSGSNSLRDSVRDGAATSPFRPQERLQKQKDKDRNWNSGGGGFGGGSASSSAQQASAAAAPATAAAATSSGARPPASQPAAPVVASRVVSPAHSAGVFAGTRQGAAPTAPLVSFPVGNGMGSAVSIGDATQAGQPSDPLNNGTGDELTGAGIQEGEPDDGRFLPDAAAAGEPPADPGAQTVPAQSMSPSGGSAPSGASSESMAQLQTIGQAALASTEYAAQLASQALAAAPASVLLDAQVASAYATQAVSLAQSGNYSGAAAYERIAMQHLQYVAAVEAAGVTK